MLKEKIMKKNLTGKGVKGMKRGLTGTLLIVGLSLGLFFLTEGNLNLAQAAYDYGAYKDFLAQLSPTLQALARLGQLQQVVFRSASGAILETVDKDGNLVKYVSGVQYEGYTYDVGQGKWYLQTLYYAKGGILQYAVRLKLEKNKDTGKYEQKSVESITYYDSVGRAEYTVSTDGRIIWRDFAKWQDLRAAWEPGATWLPTEYADWDNDKKEAFWKNLYNQILGNIQKAKEDGSAEFTFTVNNITYRFKLVRRNDGGMDLKFDRDNNPNTGEGGYETTLPHTIRNFEIGEALSIDALTPELIGMFRQAVTNGTPRAAVRLGDKTVVVELTDVFLSGADIIEMGEEGIKKYLDSLGVDMGAIRLIESDSWKIYRNWLQLRNAYENTIRNLITGYNDWTDAMKENFWVQLYNQIIGNFRKADNKGESEFSVKISGKDVNGRDVNIDITFRLRKDEDNFHLEFKSGTTWSGILTIAKTDIKFGSDTLVIGPGADGKYGTDDDEKIDIGKATAEHLAKSQLAAVAMMLQAAVESGTSAGENALDLKIQEGVMDVDNRIPLNGQELVKNLDKFKQGMLSSPWAEELGLKNWTDEQWRELYDKVFSLVDSDPNNNYPYNQIFRITVGNLTYEIKFEQEHPTPGEGFRIVMRKQQEGSQWRWVRHVTFGAIREGEPREEIYAKHKYFVSSYIILTGKFANTVISNLTDPTTIGKRVKILDDPGLWGDPNVVGTINYDAATGRLTATITQWQDAFGNWHYGSWTVTLDFSRIADTQLRERARQQFIDAARNGYLLQFHGMGDDVRDGQIFYILGLGFYYE